MIFMLPNPVTNYLSVTSTQIINIITIYNVIGQAMITENTNKKTTLINVANLPMGIYYLMINSKEVRKFVKM